MLTPTYPLVYRPSKARRARRPAAPATPNQITAVNYGSGVKQIVVTLSNAVTSWDDVSKLLGVFVEGVDWLSATSIDASDPKNVVFTFDDDVSSATLWRVPGAENWQFADDQPLVDPFLGSIG